MKKSNPISPKESPIKIIMGEQQIHPMTYELTSGNKIDLILKFEIKDDFINHKIDDQLKVRIELFDKYLSFTGLVTQTSISGISNPIETINIFGPKTEWKNIQ